MASQRAMAPGEIESRLREFFSEHSGDIVAVYLFGSQARGTEAQLERLLGRSVQVVASFVTDRELIAKKLALIEHRLDDLLRFVTLIRSKLA